MKKISSNLFILIESIILILIIITEGILFEVNTSAFSNSGLILSLIYNAILVLMVSLEIILYKGKRYIKGIIVLLFIISLIIITLTYNAKLDSNLTTKNSLMIYITMFSYLSILIYNGILYSFSYKDNKDINVVKDDFMASLDNNKKEEENKVEEKDEKISLEQMWGGSSYKEEKEEAESYDRDKYFRNQRNLEDNREKNSAYTSFNNLNNTLPIGFVSKSERTIYIILLMAPSLIFLALIGVLLYLNPNGFIYYMLGILALDIGLSFLTKYYRFHKENGPIKRLIKTLDYDKFNKEVDLILKENLHPETRNYYLIVKKEYLSYINLEEAKKIETKKPEVLNYYITYAFAKLNYYLINLNSSKYKEYYDEIKVLPIFNTNAGVANLLNQNKMIADALFGSSVTKNIDQVFNTNTKSKIENIVCKYYKAIYYKKNGDSINANKLIDELINENHPFNEIKKKALELKDM